MKLFGYEIGIKKSLQSVPSSGWYPLVRETSAGAWQRSETLDATTALAHSTLFACVSLISNDISKLPISISEHKGTYWAPTPHAYDVLLKRPNQYQNRIQFISAWILSKLLHGNTYVLKQYNAKGSVAAMHIIDPKRVQPLIADDGSVFYRISSNDKLTNTDNVTVPSRAIIHDRNICPFHPLVGVSPLVAASLAANQAINIQQNSSTFFKNAAQPGGILSTPKTLPQDQGDRLRDYWAANYTGVKAGGVAVLGDDVKFYPMGTAPVDAQLIEQLGFTSLDVARAFGVPAWKVSSGPSAPYTSSEATNLQYLSDCLQVHIESLEIALDQGLDLPPNQRTELDESSLLRLDTKTRTEVLASSVKAGLMTINEARAKEGRAPVPGGDETYRQMQDLPLTGVQP